MTTAPSHSDTPGAVDHMKSGSRSRVAAGGSTLAAGRQSDAVDGRSIEAANTAPGRTSVADPSSATAGTPDGVTGAAVSEAAPSVVRVGRFQYRPHNCFACGQLNSGGLHLALHVDGERCWTDFAIPKRFEGWEGVTHGGILSAIVDEVMAWSLITVDHVGVTARLEVDFRRPVAIDQPIRAEGWIVERRRRRFDTAAVVVDRESGGILVEARAIYLAADSARSREIRERYGFSIVRDDDVRDDDPVDPAVGAPTADKDRQAVGGETFLRAARR